MLRPSDFTRMISSADNALITGSFEVSVVDSTPPPPRVSPDPGDTVRLPVIDRPIATALLAAAR